MEIDSAISSQERMIELLKERRSAIITQAVTKGLDLGAKMKDSGVPWLGQVPAHWEVKRLRHLAKVMPSNIDKKTVEGESQVRLCNYTDVYYNERIVLGPDYMVASATDDQISKFNLRIGDVIITKDSEEPDDIGIPACVYETAPDLVCGYHLAILRPFEPALGPFIARSVSSSASKAHFFVSAKGVTRYALGYYAIADMPILLPPSDEALAVAAYINGAVMEIDSAISSQERMIELLKERRSAIITRAVTGQIDVRQEGLSP
jgi:type I restriction enzyme S subunit